jgi:hypothetical protein
MQFCNVSEDHTGGQKSDVLVEFVQHALQRGLLLNEAITHQEPSRIKAANNPRELLDDCLMDFALHRSEDIPIPEEHCSRRAHARRKRHERRFHIV